MKTHTLNSTQILSAFWYIQHSNLIFSGTLFQVKRDAGAAAQGIE